MSSEPVPIANISKEVNIEENLPSVRGHLHSPIPPTEYVYLDILDTLRLSNSPYIPPHQWQIPFPSDSFACVSICPNSET